MGRRIGFIVALATMLVFVACGGDIPTGLRGVAVAGGNGPVAITVSAGVIPTISWSGGDALRLTITQANGSGLFWDLEALDPQVGFSPPVTHTFVPNTARERSEGVILTADTDYRVTIVRTDGVQGSRVFRP